MLISIQFDASIDKHVNHFEIIIHTLPSTHQRHNPELWLFSPLQIGIIDSKWEILSVECRQFSLGVVWDIFLSKAAIVTIRIVTVPIIPVKLITCWVKPMSKKRLLLLFYSIFDSCDSLDFCRNVSKHIYHFKNYTAPSPPPTPICSNGWRNLTKYPVDAKVHACYNNRNTTILLYVLVHHWV